MAYPTFTPRRHPDYHENKFQPREPQARVGVFLHAHYFQSALLPNLVQQINRHGNLSIKKLFATTTLTADWLEAVQQYAFQLQCSLDNHSASVSGQLIVAAMEAMVNKQVDTIAVCVNDPAQSALVHYARAAGIKVLGIGVDNSRALHALCDYSLKLDGARFDTSRQERFEREPVWQNFTPSSSLAQQNHHATSAHAPVAANNLTHHAPDHEHEQEDDAQPDASSKRIIRSLPLRMMVYKAIRDCAEIDGWTLTTKVGSYLRYLQPDFDYKLLGYPKLSDFLRAIPGLQLRYESPTRLFCRKIDYAPLLDLLDQAMREYQDEDGWADMDDVEDFIADDWSYREYGFESFRDLLDTVVGAEVDDEHHLMRYTRTTRYSTP